MSSNIRAGQALLLQAGAIFDNLKAVSKLAIMLFHIEISIAVLNTLRTGAGLNPAPVLVIHETCLNSGKTQLPTVWESE